MIMVTPTTRAPCSSAPRPPELRSYLQIVENRWEDGRTQTTGHRHPGTTRSTATDRTTRRPAGLGGTSGPVRVAALGPRQGATPTITTRRIGPALIFERLWRETGCRAGHRATPGRTPLRVRRRAGDLPDGPPSPLRPGKRPGRRQVEDGLPDRGRATTSNSTTSTGPWPGSARSCPRTSRRTRRRSHPAASRTGSRRGCSITGGTSSATCNWSSSTPPRSTSRAKAARTSASGGSARTIGPTCTRWSSGRCSTARGGRSVANCGRATRPM